MACTTVSFESARVGLFGIEEGYSGVTCSSPAWHDHCMYWLFWNRQLQLDSLMFSSSQC